MMPSRLGPSHLDPFRLGLTGSIGMGKSTTAGFFAAAGCPVWDADAAVRRLYAPGGAAVAPVGAWLPGAIVNGAVDRGILKQEIARNPQALARIEHMVHPLLGADRGQFTRQATGDILVFDIPLLFENALAADMDATLLVTAPPALQRARVLARPGMTEAMFDTLLARQMPDAQKRSLATHIIETLGLDAAEQAVLALITYIRGLRHA